MIAPSEPAWHTIVRQVPEPAERLAKAFWPGRLSIALAASLELDERVSLRDAAGRATVAVRQPGPCAAADLVRAFLGPLTATSANVSGEAPLLDAASVHETFADAVESGDLVVVEGDAPGGPPSTIVAFDGDDWRIVREGAVSGAEVEAVLS